MIVSDRQHVTLSGMAYGMRVLLQDRNSRQYFKWEHEWVSDSSMATNFSNTSQALHSAAGHRHRLLDIILKFDNPRYDLRIPIPQRPG
jgi:hypothetical protein